MIEVRLHGRGGQGAVTAAELVAQAAIASGKFAQAFPNFGPERRGAPVTAFLRVSKEPIYLRERIVSPDVVIVLDPSLVGMVDVTEGLSSGGTVVVNAPAARGAWFDGLAERHRVAIVDAGKIAMEALGVPITNTAIIGALVRATALVSLDALGGPLQKRFGNLAEKNRIAMKRAFEQTRIEPPRTQEGTCDALPPVPWERVLAGEALHPWREVEIGCDIERAGSSREFATGNWRTSGRPVLNEERCVSCGICWILCPDAAFRPQEPAGYRWEERYCKGCGICAAVCPKGALSMEVE